MRIHVRAIGLATLATSLPALAHGDEVHPAPPFDPFQVDQMRTEKLAWTFNREAEFRFACLTPGHYESGMVGKVVVSLGKSEQVTLTAVRAVRLGKDMTI